MVDVGGGRRAQQGGAPPCLEIPRLVVLCLVDKGDGRFCQVVTCGAEGHCAGNLELSTIQSEKCLVILATFFVVFAVFEDSDAGQFLAFCIRCELYLVANLVRLFAFFTVAPDVELSVGLNGVLKCCKNTQMLHLIHNR